MHEIIRVRSVNVLNGFMVRLGFSDATTRDVDLGRYLNGPVFEAIRNDPARFREVSVDQRAGTIAWPNGADIDPEVLYHDFSADDETRRSAPATADHAPLK